MLKLITRALLTQNAITLNVLSPIVIGLLLFPLFMGAGNTLSAEPTGVVRGQAVSPGHFRVPKQNRPFPNTSKIVNKYIEEKVASGELDPEEYQQLKQQRDDLREQMKALRNSGDTAAIVEKMAEIRQQRQLQRNYARTLVSNDSELQHRLRERRYQIRRQQLDRQLEILERRRERLQDARRRESSG